MFDLQANDTGEGEYSNSNIGNKRDGMNSLNNSIVNSPTILKGMSHEMRTHMNAIVAFSFLMKENCSDNDEREEFRNQILTSCEQLLELFDSFLDSAIIDTGNSKTDVRICRLDSVLDELLSEFREVINKEDHKNVELLTEIRYTNSLQVHIDKNKIFRIIRSLFQNSVKNTKSGYIKIGYSFSDDKVTFYVLDSGQGYLKCREFLHSENLNESLASYNDTTTAINITLARKLVHMLDGTIRIECNGLEGSGIYFSVPAKKAFNSDFNFTRQIKSMIMI
jgi:K+-sensing histidine kinase KdpD